MSKLTQMKLMGMRSFGTEAGDEQDIVFSCPVTLFLGQNGCGKTTIIEAIKYAITGDLPGGAKAGQGFIYDPQMAMKVETRGQVKLKVQDITGQSFTVTKISTVKQLKDKQTFKNIDSIISRGAEILTNKCIDVHRKMCTILGVPKAILNYVIFCHQEDSHWPLEEPKKLKERFDAIFDSSKYNKCIENMLKLKKQKLEEIKLLRNEVEYKRSNKIQMEKKRDVLREKEVRYMELIESLKEISESLEPIQNKLDDLYQLESNINKLINQKQQVVLQIKNNKELQKDILSNTKEMDCTDEELEDKISSFEADSKITENEIKELEDSKKEIDFKENNLRNETNKEQINLGKLQGEQKENKREINTKNTLIKESISDFDLTIDISSDTEDTINAFKIHLKNSESEIQQFELSADIKEKDLQNEIDRHRTKYIQLKQSVESKLKQLSELKTEYQKVNRKLGELNSCDDQLQQIETRLARTENEITQVESQLNTNELRVEIQNNKNNLNILDEQLQKVDNEIQIMQTYCSIQAELDVQNDNLLKKQNDVKKLKLKHENNFEHIFQEDIPETNFKHSLERYLKIQTLSVNEINIKINDKEKKLATIEANVSLQKEKLATMRKDFERESLLITEYFQDLPFEEVESKVSKIIDDLQDKKGICKSSIKMYSTFIKSFKETKPCCPVCMRDVQEKEQVKKIIEEIEKKIKLFPEDEKTTEKKLVEAQKRHTKIYELKPMYTKVQQVRKKDMPVLIEKISELNIDLKNTSDDLKGLRTSIETPKKDQELANKLMSDVALIDQYDIEIKKIQNEIVSLSSRIPTSETNRSMQEAIYEQDNLKSSLKSLRSKIEDSNNKLNKHSELLQTLKSSKNDLIAKELNIRKDLQGKDQLEIKQEEIETKISVIDKEISETKTEIEPTKAELNNAIETKDTHKVECRLKKQEMSNKINEFKKKLDEITRLQKSINNFVKRNVDEQVEIINKLIDKYNQQLKSYSDKKNQITKNMEELKDQVMNRRTYYRELQDNKKLREKKEKVIILQKELKEYDDKIGNRDLRSIQQQISKLDEKLSESNLEISKFKGQITELKNSIKDATKELSEPIYANVNTEFKKKFVEHKILIKAVEDLTIFAKAIDWAMLQYHKQQMVYINETIRELWRTIYRGNDIDYIELKTEMDITKSSSNRRVYDYRLVQVKNDVELEMRGRCSAGQKVLASLVIRIALADTFSTKCGILALDEPTTNLDRENVESLCESLCELIARKRHQKNFQLLIITHDQEFLEKLGRNVLIDKYYLVSRNDQGKSIVTLKNNTF